MLLSLLSNLAVKMEQLNTSSPRANFSFRLPIPAFVNITSVPLRIIPIHPLRKPPSFINISISVKNISQVDGPLRLPTFGFGVYHIYMSPSSPERIDLRHYADDQANSSTDDKDQCDSKGSVLGLDLVWTILVIA
jgi:hypothetical protein